MAVDRCVCHDVSFASLKRIAAERSLDLEGLSRVTGCCTGCGFCRPYVERMLETGETVFAVFERGAADGSE